MTKKHRGALVREVSDGFPFCQIDCEACDEWLELEPDEVQIVDGALVPVNGIECAPGVKWEWNGEIIDFQTGGRTRD